MQVDITKIKSIREQQQVMKLQSDAAWYEMKAALIRAYLTVRYYNPEQPRVPAGNGRESGRWGDGSGIRLPGQPRMRRIRLAQTALAEANRFLKEDVEELRINGREEELDPVQAYQYAFGMAARNTVVRWAQSVDPSYRPPSGLYESVDGLIAQIGYERDDAELFLINYRRNALGLSPLTPEEFRSDFSPSIRNVPPDDIFAPNGVRVGVRLTGATNIRTVDQETFNNLVIQSTFGQNNVSLRPTYGIQYQRSDGSIIGFRISRQNGPTIEVMRNSNQDATLPRAFKVHRQ